MALTAPMRNRSQQHRSYRNGEAEVETQSMDFVYTVAEAARHLKIGRTAMYELVMSGQIRSVTIGRSRRIPASCIAEYLSHLLDQPADFPAAA
ncbi:helix-turn-helix domain-containing protein [Actinoplanes sp. NPDC051470]|uniref:helix-turn-helix domain-containing protein n=1 Tax=Actinoplanes sp. NPDC051470 TaxID=3157224 RepID=UPI003449DEE5